MLGRWVHTLALATAFYISLVAALGQKKTVAFDKQSNSIDLVSKGKSAQVTVDGNGMNNSSPNSYSDSFF